jgi:hypothetical protein
MDLETIKTYAIAGALIFLFLALIFAFFFRKRMYCLVLDYVVDCGLSFLDEPFGGIVGADWGDLIAVAIIFVRAKHFLGNAVLAVVLLEAFNFFLGALPPVEVVTNLFPAVTVARFAPLLNEFGPAKRMIKRVKDGIRAFSQEHMGLKVEEETFEKAEERIEEENPIAAIALLKSVELLLDRMLEKRIAQSTKLFVAVDDNAKVFHDSPLFSNPETREVAAELLASIMMPGLKAGSSALVQAKKRAKKAQPSYVLNLNRCVPKGRLSTLSDQRGVYQTS